MKKFHSVLFSILITIGLVSFYSCTQKEVIHFKIMSYNIRHGEGMDTILDLSRSAGIIKSQAPDWCALQEVDNFCLRSDSINQTDYLAKETSMEGVFGKFMDFQQGEYGMSTLSARSIVSTKIVQLPDGKYEPRSSIVQEIQITKKETIVVANVHFDWVDGEEGISNRLHQAKSLMKYINSLGKACFIVGDFNCTPDSPTMQYFAKEGFSFVEKGGDNLSFQGKGKTEIDHVIYRGTQKVRFKKEKALLLEEPFISDHRPLIVEMEITVN